MQMEQGRDISREVERGRVWRQALLLLLGTSSKLADLPDKLPP